MKITNDKSGATVETDALATMPLFAIAALVRHDWLNVNFAAMPYLDALAQLNELSDNYGADSARGIALYFLSNASGWRGPIASAVKSELRSRLGVK